jgi:DNA-directed RNA polymerase I subunit RPA2
MTKNSQEKPSIFKVLEYSKESKFPSSSKSKLVKLQKVAAPHLESFNQLFTGDKLLDRACYSLPHVTAFNQGNKIEFFLTTPVVGVPTDEKQQKLMYPAACRESQSSYKAKFQIKLNWRVNNGPVQSEIKSLGYLPIMVNSIKCNLAGKSPKEFVEKHEDPEEFGGYFVSNGIERLIRLLIVPRRNHPTSIFRPSFQNRGPTYSKFGVSIRSCRRDQTSQTLTLHYLTDGQVNLRFSYRKNEYMVPVLLILRALQQTCDKEIFDKITMGNYGNTFLTDRVEMLLRSFKRFSSMYDSNR